MKREPSLFEARKKKPVAFEFVLDALAELEITTRPMFGCTGVYLGSLYLMALRDKGDFDSGVWLATSPEHHASLTKDLPSLRSIALFGTDESAWRNIPVDSDRFEEDALAACALVVKGDPRIGKVPASKRLKAKRQAAKQETAPKPSKKPAKKVAKKAVKKPVKRAAKKPAT